MYRHNGAAATSVQNTLVLVGDSNSYRIAITHVPEGATHIELVSTGYSSGTSVLTLSSAGGTGGTSGPIQVYGTVGSGSDGSSTNPIIVSGLDASGINLPLGVGMSGAASPQTVLLVGGRDTSDANNLRPFSTDTSGNVNVNLVNSSGTVHVLPPTAGGADVWGPIVVGPAATLVLDSYSNRIGGMLQNLSAAPVTCGYSNTVTPTTGFVIAGGLSAYDGNGASAPLAGGYTGQIWCITVSGSVNLFVSDF